MLKKKVPIGYENFQEVIEKDLYYVDKTKVIEQLLDDKNKVALFPRPRRFGKTLFMSMLDNFYDIEKKSANENLFEGLYIDSSKYKDYRNSYPVISLSFKDLKQNKFDSVINQLKILMSRIYNEKIYLSDKLDGIELKTFNNILFQKCSIDELKISIKFLSDIMYKYYNIRVIILIDEYDVPIQEGYLDGFYDEVIDFMRTFLSSAMKGNSSLEMGILTGVLKVSKESIFSDLNNLKVYSIMDSKYEEYFGFTEAETKSILEYYDLSLTDEVKKMYDGYDFAGVSIYNPWSILNYVDSRRLNLYWVNTSGNDLIKKLLLSTNIDNKIQIEKLALNEDLPFVYNDKITYQDFDDYNNLNNILNILFSSGYLTLARQEVNDFGVIKDYVKIPNLEVKMLITSIMSSLSRYGDDNKNINLIFEFNEAMLHGDKAKLEVILNRMFQSISYMDSQEYFYHAYILGILKSFLDSDKFVIKSNRETGLGRCDVYIRKIDNSIGFILEFKLASSVSEMEEMAMIAIKQMKEKEYYKELIDEGVKEIREIAMVFCDKKIIVR